MPSEVVMPRMGLTQTEGTLIRWYKQEGEPVTAGEAICEIETDKATVDVEAPASGVLGRRRLEEGATVPIGYQIAWIVAPGEAAPPSPDTATPAGSPPPLADSATRTVSRPVDTPPAAASAPSPSLRAATGTSSSAPPPSSPAARRLARELGVDLLTLRASGAAGRIQEEDVRRAAAAQAPVGTGGRRVELSRPRQIAAQRLTESFQNVPHFYLRVVIDATTLVNRKQQLQSQAVTYSDLLVHATARALAAHPSLNARWDNAAIWQFDRVDIGLAVHTDRGLLVPVFRDPGSSSLADLAHERSRLVERAHAGRLTLEEMEGATFTITNLGMHHVDSAWPVINPPQAAILAVGAIAPRVLAIDGTPTVRPTLELVLAIDHRVLDGVDAAAFLDGLRAELEQPSTPSWTA